MLERVRVPSLYVLPTAKHPIRFHQDRVLCEKRGHRCSVVFLVCLIQRLMKLTELLKCFGNPEKITLLGCSWIGCVFLLGECHQSEADCQSD